MSALKVLQLQRHTDVLGEERKRLLDSAREQTFTSATVLGEAPERQSWRRASVCFNWPLMAEARAALIRALGVGDGDVIDVQLTCSGEGDFFKAHYDNNWPETAMRKTTFVYYLGDFATFTCGRLLFPERGISVDPVDDSMIVFPAGELHEIEVVRAAQLRQPLQAPDWCPWKMTKAARYTLNGWIG